MHLQSKLSCCKTRPIACKLRHRPADAFFLAQIVQRTLQCDWEFPASCVVSRECRDLLRNLIKKVCLDCRRLSSAGVSVCQALARPDLQPPAAGAQAPACSQDPNQRFGTAEIMRHPWFLVGLPQGWDQLNSWCLRNKASLAPAHTCRDTSHLSSKAWDPCNASSAVHGICCLQPYTFRYCAPNLFCRPTAGSDRCALSAGLPALAGRSG